MSDDFPQGEVKFLGGSWSTKSGTSIRFEAAEREFLDTLNDMGVGTRFMLVLAPIADDEELDTDKIEKAKRAKDLVKSAGILSNDKAFWGWVSEKARMEVNSKDDAATAMRSLLGIKSRAEIGKVERVANNFTRMREDFLRDVGRIQEGGQ
jgi:hypothetical protein